MVEGADEGVKGVAVGVIEAANIMVAADITQTEAINEAAMMTDVTTMAMVRKNFVKLVNFREFNTIT